MVLVGVEKERRTAGRPGGSVGNLETFCRWDVHSNLASLSGTNWNFFSHHAQQVENDYVVGTQNSISRSTRERND